MRGPLIRHRFKIRCETADNSCAGKPPVHHEFLSLLCVCSCSLLVAFTMIVFPPETHQLVIGWRYLRWTFAQARAVAEEGCSRRPGCPDRKIRPLVILFALLFGFPLVDWRLESSGRNDERLKWNQGGSRRRDSDIALAGRGGGGGRAYLFFWGAADR